jgi:hypothetical protein
MAEGLVSGPSGTPRNPIYPPWAWAEVAAAIYLMHHKHLSREDVRIGRSHVLECVEAGKPVVERLTFLHEYSPADYSNVFLWIAATLKIQQDWSPEREAQITEKRTPQGWVWLFAIAPKEKGLPVVDRIVRAEENERPTA